MDKKVQFNVDLDDSFELFAYQVLSVFESVPLEFQYIDGIGMNVRNRLS